MDAVPRHRCDATCVCPIHQSPLLYAPAIDDHACQEATCVLANGTAPVYDASLRYYFIQARWEHGHGALVDGCTLCQAEYKEASAWRADRASW